MILLIDTRSTLFAYFDNDIRYVLIRLVLNEKDNDEYIYDK